MVNEYHAANYSLKSSFQCYMSILGSGNLSALAFEYQDCKYDAEWKDADCNN